MSFLSVKQVSKSYGPKWNRSEVLSNINLEIEEGEFVAIIGYSGAGKTTLMSLLAGLIEPDTGEVLLAGKEMHGPGPDRGIVFQNYSLLPWLSVYENIALAVDQVFPTWTAVKRRDHVEKAIATVNLTPARNKVPGELSGGMRQRVSVARTFAINPRILLLDEPLSALDALTRANLQDEISRLWQEDKKTVVLVTNDPDEAILLADRVIPLTAGPRATLLESIPVTIPRPRDRKTALESSDAKRIRLEIIERLQSSKKQASQAVVRKLILPNIEPEDLTRSRGVPLFGARRKPLRKNEVQPVTFKIES
ncbi:MAG TPA: ABC transporter ATP-binding protein [Chthoniobacterales bacterium]|jgi:nitrate/nitrite transport system ATP-binding protein